MLQKEGTIKAHLSILKQLSSFFLRCIFGAVAGYALLDSPATMLAQNQVVAQQGKPLSRDATYVLQTSVREVLLYCAVFDGKGTLVTGLDQHAFKVTEDKSPAVVVYFSQKDVPVALDLVLDDSGSMKDKRPSVEAAALTLIKASNHDDETAVTNFADSAYLDQDFTGDFHRLDLAIAQSKTVSGGTALFDTVIAAADHLSHASQRSKQVIVVITDGRDNASSVDLEAAIRRVQTVNGPVIYSIGLLFDVPGNEARRARHDLQALSAETGGIAFFPHSAAEVDTVAAEVARDIRNQYTVSYRPPINATAGSYHTIGVQASARDRGKLTVRTRKGYVWNPTSTLEDKPTAALFSQP